MKIDFQKFLTHLGNSGLEKFAADIAPGIENYFVNLKHGDLAKWFAAIEALPAVDGLAIDLSSDTVGIGSAGDVDAKLRPEIIENLMKLHPWRKGPFELFGIKIDTEWRSDLKWQRLIGCIKPLAGKTVLDVGCGNGYHCLRMLGAGATAVVGIDPMLLFVTQFQLLNKYVQTDMASVLPLGIDEMPVDAHCFDAVFSMGVLYHRKDAAEHIERLKGALKSGGELVLETLVIESDGEEMLVPEGRYGKMRNVWNIPSPALLKKWVEAAGFVNARIIDITKTTTKEQRSTEWMHYESLPDYLDKQNENLTIEGHPAPIRAIMLAEKP
ncbi:MAG: tRNA 5-methoxyuridine(34)/uridine 5-oxyacetic acid(34) synthase CmoB [Planctomycetes bacterium]|nr:tRNA 5-methoxyuridine(34)/uridine 5-oxyacetic acid(34) synthase CmoB [Planctomycetota bacterium]